jgi:anti-anti-sigma regulatory factor
MENPLHNEDEGNFSLPPLLDLTAVEPLHRVLLDHARSGDPLVVIGSAVVRVSTAAVQILLAAAADARARGASFPLRDPSPELTDALTDLGVASHFGF